MREPGAIKGPIGERLIRLWRFVFPGDWARSLAVVLVVGAVLAASGGFGTEAMPLAARFAYWLGLMLCGAMLGRFAGRRMIPRSWFETRPVSAAALMTLVIGLPMTVIAALASEWLAGRTAHVAHIWQISAVVLATTACMVLLSFLVHARAAAKTHEAAEGAPPSRFLARLPAKLAGAELRAVEAEDHYLRLHTSRGEDLILMRLADALVELEGIEGARTHRSWWVARAAVVSAERAEGRATLTLEGGLRAPVSRAYVGALRQAGWF